MAFFNVIVPADSVRSSNAEPEKEIGGMEISSEQSSPQLVTESKLMDSPSTCSNTSLKQVKHKKRTWNSLSLLVYLAVKTLSRLFNYFPITNYSAACFVFLQEICEANEPSSSSNASTLICRVTENFEDLDTMSDATSKPSPISVLEPLFQEDDISPPGIKYSNGEIITDIVNEYSCIWFIIMQLMFENFPL